MHLFRASNFTRPRYDATLLFFGARIHCSVVCSILFSALSGVLREVCMAPRTRLPIFSKNRGVLCQVTHDEMAFSKVSFLGI